MQVCHHMNGAFEYLENYKTFDTRSNNWLAGKAVAFGSMLKKSIVRMNGGAEALAGMTRAAMVVG